MSLAQQIDFKAGFYPHEALPPTNFLPGCLLDPVPKGPQPMTQAFLGPTVIENDPIEARKLLYSSISLRPLPNPPPRRGWKHFQEWNVIGDWKCFQGSNRGWKHFQGSNGVETFPGLGRGEERKKASEQLNQSQNSAGRIAWSGNHKEMLQKGKKADGTPFTSEGDVGRAYVGRTGAQPHVALVPV